MDAYALVERNVTRYSRPLSSSPAAKYESLPPSKRHRLNCTRYTCLVSRLRFRQLDMSNTAPGRAEVAHRVGDAASAMRQELKNDPSALMQKAHGFGIDFSRLPRPAPLGWVAGITKKRFETSTVAFVAAARAAVNRPLTKAETDAFAESHAKGLIIRSYGGLPILLTAAIPAWASRNTFKFPFLKGRSNFSPDHFPSRKYAWLEGQRARIVWHSVRLNLYFAVSYIAWGAFLGMVGTASALNEARADKRLRQYQEGMKAVISGRPAPLPNYEAEGGYNDQPQEATDDWTTGDNQASSQANSQTTAAAQPYRPQWQQQPQRSQPRWQSMRTQTEAAPGQEQQAFDDDPSLFDDGSPVAPTHRQDQPRTTGPTSGSAWDRIRQQSASQSQESGNRGTWGRNRQQPAPSQERNEYSYSKSDEEKSLAKEQAQKEFDDMLERERRGEEDPRRRR
jgi:hypothetical protein